MSTEVTESRDLATLPSSVETGPWLSVLSSRSTHWRMIRAD